MAARFGEPPSSRERHPASGSAPPLSVLLLCGGASRRFGCDKGLALFRGEPLAARMIARLSRLTDDLRISANRPEAYRVFGPPLVTDRLPGRGPLAGIEAGLQAARYDYLAVVACDLPFASAALLRFMAARAAGNDVVVPVRTATHRAWRGGPLGPRGADAEPHHQDASQDERRYEPLHAIYRRSCLAPIRRALSRGEHKIVHAYAQLRIREVPAEEWEALPGVTSLVFENINTLEDLSRLEAQEDPAQ